MGLLEKIFPKQRENNIDGYFKTLNAYIPAFTTYAGGIYEMELTRAAIHSFATQCAKLKPEIQGSAYKNLEKTLQFKPNPYMDTYKFIYRLATILSIDTTAFIVPLYANDYETIVGFYPLLPQRTEILDVKGEPWLRYTFSNGQKAAIELNKVGILTQYQYQDDFFGTGNKALLPTMQLLDIQKQGIEEGIKQSAMLRFMAKVGQSLRPEDIKKERDRFSKDNLSSDNTSGVMMFDAKYSEVKQIESKPFIVDAEQMKIIQTNVYNYFGTNEKVLQNDWTEDGWNAYYEGKIEPFALQLSLVMSNMTFTQKELAFGNQILFTSNRMQYASNNTKLQVSSQMFDRGILTTNQVMDIWNMPHVEDGDKRYIRKEYSEVNKLDGGEGNAIKG
ncbi:phage portal protein [Sedimentibacter sp.]|uniref:phage portal protein n=1 Tax=Sedimentibacter sp. TaxID=1960295 RepID=UPI0028AC01C4|nr:phage portal protein [Sedimentibacter sp.]